MITFFLIIIVMIIILTITMLMMTMPMMIMFVRPNDPGRLLRACIQDALPSRIFIGSVNLYENIALTDFVGFFVGPRISSKHKSELLREMPIAVIWLAAVRRRSCGVKRSIFIFTRFLSSA